MNEIKKMIGAVAPFIGSLLGGSFGLAAGKVVSNVLLNKEDATEDEIKVALSSATPEQLIELKKQDVAYKAKMMELGITEKKIAELDRDSARNREILLKDNMPAVMSMMVTIGFFSVLATLLFYPVPSSGKDILNIMLGALGSGWMAAMTYYFGSSSDSALKTHLLSDRGNT